MMQAELTTKQDWFVIDGPDGLIPIQVELVGDIPTSDLDQFIPYYGPGITSVTKMKGYGVRLNAPGYLDCTAWEVYSNLQTAIDRYNELKELFVYE